MTILDTYGTNSCSAKELSDLLADRLALTFAERESDYRGIYYLATLADGTRLQVLPNTVPGDGGEEELYDDEYPDVSVLVLVLVTSPADAQVLGDELTAIEGLNRLASSRR
ncbi:hypothetical protein ACFYU9_05375 [Streptomyces sp. NPDC004327]|uniref:hypothetical protein n=1 Tax=Streptomyces sp. NPDC004327 TaxID=3364699 RepID=UPI003699D68F